MNNRKALMTAPKTILTISLIWSLGFLFSLGFGLFGKEQLDMAVNVFELTYGLLTGIVVLMHIKLAIDRYIIVGTALAVFSWTLGQIYWLSYTTIKGDILPYPSVGDMGYTGTYFLLIGVMGIIIIRQPDAGRKRYNYSAFLIMLVPVVLLLSGKERIEALVFNFILAAAISFAVFKAFDLLYFKKYRWFAAGIFLFAITDVVFMISASLFPENYLFAADTLYPVCIGLISYGVLKGGCKING